MKKLHREKSLKRKGDAQISDYSDCPGYEFSFEIQY
jgi:hypothetical protein